MRIRSLLAAIALCAIGLPFAFAATSVEKITNDKVVVTEDTLAPGESEAVPSKRSRMLVYMDDATGQSTGSDGRKEVTFHKGQVDFECCRDTILNAGSSPMHFVRIDFLAAGSPETWGMTGLAPNYKMLQENRYARAYDIKIPAQTFEPQHSHHDRVVVCLSGAELEHILPNGEKQPSTLKTGEVVWRLGATHIGHNMGHTDLWVIAVEPK
jgi:hypothetical protein